MGILEEGGPPSTPTQWKALPGLSPSPHQPHTGGGAEVVTQGS